MLEKEVYEKLYEIVEENSGNADEMRWSKKAFLIDVSRDVFHTNVGEWSELDNKDFFILFYRSIYGRLPNTHAADSGRKTFDLDKDSFQRKLIKEGMNSLEAKLADPIVYNLHVLNEKETTGYKPFKLHHLLWKVYRLVRYQPFSQDTKEKIKKLVRW